MASVTLNSETTATCQSQERPVMPVYGSCEEAESAGHQRKLEPGRRTGVLQKATVPSARDGDGDGIVCER